MGPGSEAGTTSVDWVDPEAVIASEAKQSRSRKEELDCFASLAMTMRGYRPTN